MGQILVIDDDIHVQRALERIVQASGHMLTRASSLAEGRAALAGQVFDVLFLDVRLPDGNGLDLLDSVSGLAAAPEIIVITGASDPDGAELAIRRGVWDYVEKPLLPAKIELPLSRALQYREAKLRCISAPRALKHSAIVGSSAAMQSCLDVVAQAAANTVAVLITGESGTGKELFARAIHDNSDRAGECFVVVDCAAMPTTLIESALFGHVRGAFTGAEQNQAGLVLQADRGTLFLDEVGELPLLMQKTFLRVLQERSYRPIGSSREQHSDFRLVAATNRDLDALVRQGLFREDLLYRLRALRLALPPLRERADDIEELALVFLRQSCTQQGLLPKAPAPEFVAGLRRYDWPGNVRELRHAIDHAVVASQHEPVLHPVHLPTEVRVHATLAGLRSPAESASTGDAAVPFASPPDPEAILSWRQFRDQALTEAERRYLTDLMRRAQGSVTRASTLAGLSRSRLYELLAKHELVGH